MAIDPNTTSMLPAAPHIDVTPGTCGGRPRIASTRIRVQDIVVWHERLGLAVDEIVSRYPHLTLSAVYAALAYYHDHREQIDLQILEGHNLVDELRRRYPSKLDDKLAANE